MEYSVKYLVLCATLLLSACNDGMVPDSGLGVTDGVRYGTVEGKIEAPWDLVYKTNPPPWIINYADRLEGEYRDKFERVLKKVYDGNLRKWYGLSGRHGYQTKAGTKTDDATELQRSMYERLIDWVEGMWCGAAGYCGIEERDDQPTPYTPSTPPSTEGLVSWHELVNGPAARYLTDNGYLMDQCYITTQYGVVNISELVNYPGNLTKDYWAPPRSRNSNIDDDRRKVYCAHKESYRLSYWAPSDKSAPIDYYLTERFALLTYFKFVYQGVAFFSKPGRYDSNGKYIKYWRNEDKIRELYVGNDPGTIQYKVMSMEHRFFNEGGHTVIGTNMPWLSPSQLKSIKTTTSFMFIGEDLRPLDGERVTAILGREWDVRDDYDDFYFISGSVGSYYYGDNPPKLRSLWKEPDYLIIADSEFADDTRPGIPIYTALTDRGTGDILQCKLQGYVIGAYNDQLYYREPYGTERETEKLMRYNPVTLECEEEPV